MITILHDETREDSVMVVFTDLDGALLDHDTYSFQPAAPALQRLRDLRVPVVFVTSKTFEEVDHWRTVMNNHSPFAVENGAAVYAPKGDPPLPGDSVRQYEGYQMVEFGVAYSELTRALKSAALEAGCCVRGFADMTAQDISRDCDLPLEQAALAKTRQYDEPFRLITGDPEVLRCAVERHGLRLKRGGRFFHITGQNDKADAVRLLIEAYRRLGPIQTIGIGDGPNDAGFLNLVDYPFLLDSPMATQIHKRVPRARTAPAGPKGWNESIHEMLAHG
jgi:mannosyl-3-phosphoglycerate phosphatase